jgi:hypothetical protein
VLFEDDTGKRWNPKVREILVMALLLRYEQFHDVLRTHLEATVVNCNSNDDTQDNRDRTFTCSSVRDHLFFCRIDQALEKAGVCRGMLGNWILKARKAFLSRNIPGIPIDKLSLYGGENGNGIYLWTPDASSITSTLLHW